MNKQTIKLTQINSNAKDGVLYEAYADKILMLRTARKVGDTECVNNYVLGQLRTAQRAGQIDFDII